ncbi:MAG: sugar phosphate isomerase/epimerase family protein [Pirellulaceae bacterium]
MKDFPFGISTGCFYRQSIFDCLRPIQSAGFSRLEICSFPDHLDYHDHQRVAEASQLIRELRMDAYSFHAPFGPEMDITHLDPQVRKRSVDEVCVAAKAAAILGVRHLVIHPGPEKSDLPKAERWDRMTNAAAELEFLAEYCRQLDIYLVLENMLPHLFFGCVTDVLWIIGAIRRTDVGVCLDTGHAHLAGDLPHVVPKLSNHLWMLHASDNSGSADDHYPPGRGGIDWEHLIRQLIKADFSGGIILEIAGTDNISETLQRAQQGQAYLCDTIRRCNSSLRRDPGDEDRREGE